MGFKENLKEELKFQDIKVKELAFSTKINKRTLDNYLRENESQPTVENAVKIAQALGTTVEYLVTGKKQAENESEKSSEKIDIHLCKKYYALIQKIDELPDGVKIPICKMISELK